MLLAKWGNLQALQLARIIQNSKTKKKKGKKYQNVYNV